MGPVALGGLAGILNLFWRERQGDPLLLELAAGDPHGNSHKLLLGRGLWGAHIPRARGPAAHPAPASFGTPLAFCFANAPGSLAGAAGAMAAGGSVTGNCLAPRRGWWGRPLVSPEGKARAGARRECEGCAWKGLSGAGERRAGACSSCCPRGSCPPRHSPRQLQLPSALGALCPASLPVHHPKITRRAADMRVCEAGIPSCLSTSASC